LIEIFELFKSDQIPQANPELINSLERKRLTQELIKIFQFTMRDEA